jgi:hypothetical protein
MPCLLPDGPTTYGRARVQEGALGLAWVRSCRQAAWFTTVGAQPEGYKWVPPQRWPEMTPTGSGGSPVAAGWSSSASIRICRRALRVAVGHCKSVMATARIDLVGAADGEDD